MPKEALVHLIGLDTEKHPFSEITPRQREVLTEAEEWCRAHNIWPKSVEQGRAFNSMVVYLHPEVAGQDPKEYYERLKHAAILYSWLFYLDDTFSNDAMQNWRSGEREAFGKVMAQARLLFGTAKDKLAFLYHIDAVMQEHPDSSLKLTEFKGVLKAFGEIEGFFEKTATSDQQLTWFRTFKKNLYGHLGQAMSNQDANKENLQPQTYVENRADVSGMKLAVDLIRYVNRNYQEPTSITQDNTLVAPAFTAPEALTPAFQDLLKQRYPEASQEISLAKALIVMERLLIDYGGIVNDIASFYKEMNDNTKFNLVAVTMGSGVDLNNSLLVLQAVQNVGALMSQLFEMAVSIKELIHNQAQALLTDASTGEKIALKEALAHAEGLYNGMLATVYWQISPDAEPRYGQGLLYLKRLMAPQSGSRQATGQLVTPKLGGTQPLASQPPAQV